jgi:diaminohydroxyphosphoribosylaminopyrimidine deaminase/5-amino-6-(5-phosphoribosylamino)uracil reductase
VHVGLEREAAVRLNQPYLTSLREGRPFVILKAATSIDGRLGLPGRRTPITSAAALRHAQYVRATVDAIGVGSETLLVDDPLLTAREVYRARPLTRVVFDRRLRTSPSARVFSTLLTGPVIILTCADAAAADRARVSALERAGGIVIAPGETGIAAGLRELPSRGIHSLLIEGGSALHCAAWDAGVVDRVQLYIAPSPLGPAGLPLLEGRAFSPAALYERSIDQLGPDVLIEGYVHRPH